MEFFRQQHWSWLLFPSPEVLPDPGIEPRSPALQADSLLSEPPGKTWINVTFFFPIKIKSLQIGNMVYISENKHMFIDN